jgi:hypothetical protein
MRFITNAKHVTMWRQGADEFGAIAAMFCPHVSVGAPSPGFSETNEA